jgi:hypothetical protein
MLCPCIAREISMKRSILSFERKRVNLTLEHSALEPHRNMLGILLHILSKAHDALRRIGFECAQ